MKTKWLVGFLLIVASACARNPQHQTPSATNYSIEVSNAKHAAVTVSYDDGGMERTLGVIGVGQSQRFSVYASNPQITVKVRSGAGALIFSSDVTLVNGRTPFLVVR